MLFDKSKNGSNELHALTGNYYKANDFNSIKPYISDAERVLCSLLGDDLFDRAQKHYSSSTFTPEDSSEDGQLVRHIQLSVALSAMLQYFKANTVSHEDSGRKINVSEHSKVPFAWMLEMDDDVMQDNYFRSLNVLYTWLEKESITEWDSSPAKKLLKQSIIQRIDEFERVYPIENSYRFFFLIIPFMLEAQNRVILPIIGEEKYNLIISGTLADPLNKIKETIKLSLPLLAIITVIKRLSIRVMPSAIVRRYSDSHEGRRGGVAVSDSSIVALIKHLQAEADVALLELKKVVNPQSSSSSTIIPNNSPDNKHFRT